MRDPLNGDIVARERDASSQIVIDNEQDWEHIVDAMSDVVYGAQGSARLVGDQRPYTVAGKTGTVQVFTVAQDQTYEADKVDENLRDHGWFVAFAPVVEPRIALAVLVENRGGGATTAAPVASLVLDAFFDYKPGALAQGETAP